MVQQEFSMYDYLIVGSGFFGSICAHELHKKGYKVCVVEKRNHIGGRLAEYKYYDMDKVILSALNFIEQIK